MKLTAEGRALVEEIQRSFEQGESVEDIATRLELTVEHIQFLTTLDTLTRERSRK